MYTRNNMEGSVVLPVSAWIQKPRPSDFCYPNDARRTPPGAITETLAVAHHVTHPRQVSACLGPPA